MKLIGKLNPNGSVNRSSTGRFTNKNKTEMMVYSDKIFVIGSRVDQLRIQKEFGKPLEVRKPNENDKKLETVKLSDIR